MIKGLSYATLLMCALPVQAEVVVFAASSLKEPLDRMAAEVPGVVISYGGSGAQARQITLGAPADIVVLANTVWMDVLVEDGHVPRDRVTDLVSNQLVLIGGTDQGPVPLTAAGVENALGQGRLAVGLTGAVPAGIYAKQALEALQIWPVVERRLAEVDNVRAALALVARGQAPLGVVYATDAKASPAIKVHALIPTQTHAPIRYQAGLISADPEAAAFFELMRGDEGQAILVDAGFLAPVGPSQ